LRVKDVTQTNGNIAEENHIASNPRWHPKWLPKSIKMAIFIFNLLWSCNFGLYTHVISVKDSTLLKKIAE
jgi:hypothetical protein